MNNLYSTLLLILLIILTIIFLRRKNSIKQSHLKEGIATPNFTEYAPKPHKIPLGEILRRYNETIHPVHLENIVKEYKYVRGSFKLELEDLSKQLIKTILGIINANSYSNYKLEDVETIIESINSSGNRLINVQFYIHEFEDHFTRKIVLEYVIYNNKHISINYIKPLSSKNELLIFPQQQQHCSDIEEKNYQDNYNRNIELDWSNKISPFWYKLDSEVYPDWIVRSGPLLQNIKTLKKVCYSQEPCKYDIDKWDTHGVNQQAKLVKSCNVINHSDRVLLPDPYINPSMFGLSN